MDTIWSDDVEDSTYAAVFEDLREKSEDVGDSVFGQVGHEEFDEKSEELDDLDANFDDVRSNDEERSFSHGSESEKSSEVRGNSRREGQSDASGKVEDISLFFIVKRSENHNS